MDMVFKRYIILLSSIVLTFVLSVSPVFADSSSINFESGTYTTGSINGQDGWSSLGSVGSGCAVYDHAVATQSSFPSFGGQSLRISDAVTSGCFGDQTFAKPLADAVGETGATAGSFSTGTLQRHFETQFDIASKVPGSQQSGMHVSVSPDRGDGSRMSYLRFDDGTSGIDVFFIDVQGTTNPANFVETQVATGLNRAATHHVKLTMDMHDGPSNDVVKVYIDGVLVHTGTSWENYYRYDSEASSEQSPRIIKTVLWRSSGTAHSSNAGNGFLFDNVSLLSKPIPAQVFNLQDKTSNDNDLTNSGGTDVTSNLPFAGSTHAADFEGSETDKMSAADSTSLSITGSLTMESWVKFESLPTPGDLEIIASKPSSYYYGLQQDGSGNYKLRAQYSTDGSYQSDNDVMSSVWTPSAGTWYHIAVVIDPSAPNIKFYVDGSQLGSTITSVTGTSIYNSSSVLYLGTHNGSNYLLDGQLDDVRIWNTTRTATQINDNKIAELEGIESGLAAYYPFEEYSLDLEDKTSNNNDLTNSDTSPISTNLPFGGSLLAADFEGSETDKMSAADSTSLSITGSLTMESWVKFESLPTPGDLEIIASKPSSYYYGLQQDGSGNYKLRAQYSTDGSYQPDNDVMSSPWSPSTGIWYHLAVVIDPSVPNMKFYINGTQHGSTVTTVTGTSINNSTSPLYLGTHTGSNYLLDGQLDDVRIWNVARTQAQIDANKNNELTGSETGLAAYYPMETL